MMPDLSPNTQAILMLTAPLIAGRGTPKSDVLTPGEYKRLARHLRDIKSQPADLVSTNAVEILRACKPVIEEDRLQSLLGRGFLLSQVVERWRARAIWVVSRADPEYPKRLIDRLRENAPAVLYGCGEMGLLETGGLAVVGSRHVDDSLIEYTLQIGQLAARAKRTLVSGGARGIDQAAMRGALEAGGKVCGVLADSLEKTAMNRENRNMLLDGQLTLISPYDPSAGFNVGNAMQRNKLIYAMSDAALVASSDFNKGGTWAGAVEQLDKLHFVPIYVRSTHDGSIGLDELRKKGALLWPNPQDPVSFESVLDNPVLTSSASSQEALLFSEPDKLNKEAPVATERVERLNLENAAFADEGLDLADLPRQGAEEELDIEQTAVTPEPELETPIARVSSLVIEESSPAELLFGAVRASMQQLLKEPMKEPDIAEALDISKAQAKIWLQRLVEEGVIQKNKKPVSYEVKQPNFL
ncbi:DNA-processing protein DprA [Pikeienuella sp. HZG-20]|uniref:DNA-processing protein DprA n=1 Tax=Paludibacillus litoralis TaxID=3133267 RepID=UPI0030ED6563